jgi:hypothetical protein
VVLVAFFSHVSKLLRQDVKLWLLPPKLIDNFLDTLKEYLSCTSISTENVLQKRGFIICRMDNVHSCDSYIPFASRVQTVCLLCRSTLVIL